MTRLDAIELLLDELKRYDPAHYHRVMCQVLNDLGYADRVEAVSELFDEPFAEERTIH